MISIDITKAKNIVHDKRREARSAEFAPLDEAIMKQIPGTDVTFVEAQRQAIRDKYATIQNEVDAAEDVATLKQIVDGL